MTNAGVIFIAGLVSGTLDITATTLLMLSRGGTFERLLQFVASGALGPASFKGGKKTAAAGLFFHFLIAFIAATIYFLLNRQLQLSQNLAILYGILYGIAVHLVMSLIVIPLSAAPKREFSTRTFLIQLIIHIFFVGLPIALTVSYLSK